MKTLLIQVFEEGQLEQRADFTQETVIVGSGPSAHLRLERPRLSRLHAMLQQDEEGQVVLSDLGWSSEGTYLDGVKISQATAIQEGSEIQLGDVVLRVFTTAQDPRSGGYALEKVVPSAKLGSPGVQASALHGGDLLGTSFGPPSSASNRTPASSGASSASNRTPASSGASSAPSRVPSGAADAFATGFGAPSVGGSAGGGLEAGEVVGGRYQVKGALGRGGMGEVWLAEDLRLHRPFALKFLAPELVGHPDALTRLHREYEVLEKLSHPGIVRVFDLSEDPALGRVFLRMEYIEGRSLLEAMEAPLREGRRPLFPLPSLLGWLEQVVEALSYAHQQGVLHRDLKPANVMLTSEGRIKVMDFGIARQVTAEESQHTTMLGSLFYAAPELTRGMAATVGTDIYSFGVLVYELLTGEPPAGRFEMPSQRVAGLPVALDGPLERMLAMSPHQRGSSLRGAWEPLRLALQGHEPPSSSPFLSPSISTPVSTPPRQASAHVTASPTPSWKEIPALDLPSSDTPSLSEARNLGTRRRGLGKVFFWLFFLGVLGGGGWFLMKARQPSLRATPNPGWGGARLSEPSTLRPGQEAKPQEAGTPGKLHLRDVLLEQAKPSPASSENATASEIPAGWKALQEAFEACHPGAECKPEEAQKAARLFREARENLQAPIPAWISMAWEGLSHAKARTLADPYRWYEGAEQAYEAWKKQKGFRGSKLRFYTQLQSHRVFGKLLWFSAQYASNPTEKQRLLGTLWQDWRFSPLARDAYSLWMQALRQGGYASVKESDLLKAARALLLPTYRQTQIAVHFFRYLKGRSGWRQKAQWGLLDAYKQQRDWSSMLAEGRSLLAELPTPSLLRSRAAKRALSHRLWLVTALAEALLHTEGLEAASTFVGASAPLPAPDQYRYLGAVAVWQREKGQLAEAIQTTQALLDLRHASPSQTRRLRHVLAAQMLAHGEAAKSQNLWSSLAQDFSLSAEDKLPFYFWAGVAASKASSSGERYFRELCTSYPLSLYGFLSCARLQRAPAPPLSGAEASFSHPTALALKASSHGRELTALWAWNELHQSPALSTEIVQASSRAFADAGDWETAFQVLTLHQTLPLYQGRLPLALLRLAFPHPADTQAALQTVASETSLEAEALLAIIRRESGFSYPTFGLRVGLMGLDPLWTTDTPNDHLANLRLGAKRLSSLQQNLSSLPLAFAAYRGSEDFLQTALSSNSFAKDQPLLWLEFFDPILHEYTLSSNGTLWYYLFYRWLSSPSSVPSLSWLP